MQRCYPYCFSCFFFSLKARHAYEFLWQSPYLRLHSTELGQALGIYTDCRQLRINNLKIVKKRVSNSVNN